MINPDVSIIITNYNYDKYLARCLRSCLSQKSVNVEVVIIDDASTDNSDSVIQTFLDDSRVRYYKNNKNVGVSVASNIGLKKSRGQFFIRVDADDFIHEEMCHYLKLYLELNKDVFCVSCDYVLVSGKEEKIERKYASKDNISCGIMYRRDLLLSLGGYNDKMRHREEEELRKRLDSYYKIHHSGMPFYRYRMHKNNKTKSLEYFKTEV